MNKTKRYRNKRYKKKTYKKSHKMKGGENNKESVANTLALRNKKKFNKPVIKDGDGWTLNSDITNCMNCSTKFNMVKRKRRRNCVVYFAMLVRLKKG